MTRLHHMLAALLAAALLLAACGGQTAMQEPTGVPADASPATGATTPGNATSQPTVEATSVPEATSPLTTDSTTRTITHALGETDITGTPERIVVLEWVYAENLLALGVQPVGVADIAGYKDWVDIPIPLSNEVVDVGTRQEPNLEKLAELDPDLIIAPASRVAEIYAQLSAIAPVLAFDPYPTDSNITQYAEMKATFMTIASVVGREAAGETVLTAMEAHFAAARVQLGAAGVTGEPFVLAQAFGEDTVSIRLFTDNAMAVEIMEQIGLENAWDDETFQQYGFTTVGIETLPELGGLNFFYVVQDDNNVFARAAVQPVWESLAFVENDTAYPLGGDTWLFGGPLSAEVLVDLVVAALPGDVATSTRVAPETPASAFPVTIEHMFGRTEILDVPQRVVTIGYSEQDPVLALDVVPVAVRAWFGEQPHAVWPWAQDELGDAEPTVLEMPFGELNFETIAALQPDLLIATHAGITAEEYATLTQIAPVLAQPAEYPAFGVPWQVQTRLIGQALGRAERADELVADVEAQIAAARAAHPAFATATVAWSFPASGNQFWVVGPDTPPLRFLTDLGLNYPDALATIVGEQDSAQISSERLELLDVDVLIMRTATPAERDAIERNPLYNQLAVAREERTIFFVGPDDPLYGALSFSTVLSLPYAIEELVPDLAAAIAAAE